MRDTIFGRVLAVAVVLAAAALTAVPARADGPLTRLTAVSVGEVTHDLALTTNRAYVSSKVGLHTFDITNPAAPTLLGSINLGGGPANGVVVSGDYAFVATYKALKVVRVRNGGNDVLQLVASRTLPRLFDIAIKGTTLYVVSFYGEVYVFNVLNPANPVQVRVLGLPMWRGNNDLDPVEDLQNGTTAGNAKGTGVAVTGNYLAAVDWGYGRLYLWNIANPTQPVFVGTHYAPFLLRVEVDPANDTVYMFSAYGATSGIYTVPISYLAANVNTNYLSCPVCGFYKSNAKMDMGGLGMVQGGRYVFFVGGKRGELHIVNVENLPTMTRAAFVEPGTPYQKMPYAMGLAARDNYLLVALGLQGLVVYQYPGLSD